MKGLIRHQFEGYGMMQGMLQQQASLLAYNDIYRILAMMAAMFIPAFLFLKKSRSRAGAAH